MRIGFHPVFVNSLTSVLKEENFNIVWEQVPLEYDYVMFEDAVISKKLDFFIFPLHLIPLKRSEKVKIWALTEREFNNYTLAVLAEKASETMTLLPEKGEVIYPTGMIIEEFKKIVPGITFKVVDEFVLMEAFMNRANDAFIIPRVYLREKDLADYKILNLNPREFSHPGGMGTWAMIGAVEDKRGQLIRKSHHGATGLITNLERKLELMVSGGLNVHAEQDHNNYYHLYASRLEEGEVKRVHISQATRNGLAEKLVEKLSL